MKGLKLSVAADTPLGMDIYQFESKGNGPVLILDRFQEQIAKIEHCEPGEVEIVTITDRDSDALLWPPVAAAR